MYRSPLLGALLFWGDLAGKFFFGCRLERLKVGLFVDGLCSGFRVRI